MTVGGLSNSGGRSARRTKKLMNTCADDWAMRVTDERVETNVFERTVRVRVVGYER